MIWLLPMAFTRRRATFNAQIVSTMSINHTKSTEAINSTEFWETSIAYYIGVYGMFTIAFVGLIGNTLAFLVFGQLKPQSGTSLYLQALAISDMVSLSWDTIISTALPLIGVQTMSHSYWTCKFGIWHDMSSSTVASCALLAVAVDRYIFLKFNIFHKKYCTRNVAILINVFLWTFTYTYCSPLIYYYEFNESAGCSLSTNPDKLDAGLKFVTFVTYGPYFAIPVVGIIVSNISIVNMLHVRKKKRERIGKSTNVSDEVSWLLVIDCLAFMVLIGIVSTLWALAWHPPEDARQKAKFHLMFVLAQFISCIEECIDFFLYIIFSKTFRSTLRKILGLTGREATLSVRQTRAIDNVDRLLLSGAVNVPVGQNQKRNMYIRDFRNNSANLLDNWVGISVSISQIRNCEDYVSL